jgi:predicted ATPase
MINLLKVENFKSLRKETFSFSKLNVITGVNSAGKSSVLQSLLLMADALNEIDNTILDNARKKLDTEMNALEAIKKQINEQINEQINKRPVDEEELKKIHVLLDDQYKRLCNMQRDVEIEVRKNLNQKLANWNFETIRNRKQNAKLVKILLNDAICAVSAERCRLLRNGLIFRKNKDFFYLSENRSGPENKEVLIERDEFGDKAEFVMGNFYRHQNDTISEELAITDDLTLSGNVDLWLTKILKNDEEEFSINLKVQKVNSDTVTPSYDFCGLPDIEPLQLGAGVSYLAKLLIVCLQAKSGQIVIVENPEMHLHPKAQSAVGHFLSFIASKGIQVIIETHCEHLINKIQYDVYKGMLRPEEVCIYYKKSSIDDFEKMTIGQDGHFQKDGQRQRFPKGFFDATLAELLEIG